MATVTQPHGISRTLPGLRRVRLRDHPTLSGRTDGDSLRADLRMTVDGLMEDLRALAEAQEQLGTQMTNVEDRLARRLNQMVLSGTLAQRPAAGVADRLYLVVTNHVPGALYFDDGTQWMLVGSPTLDTQRATLADGATSQTFTVAQTSAIYVAVFATTWWTMVRITVQTATVLTVAFSNPAAAGDVITVVIP